MVCEAELGAAETCVKGDESCTCFNPDTFITEFPENAENFFRSSLAFKNPGDAEFCVEANWRVCKRYYPEEDGEAVSKKINACLWKDKERKK